jgi:hypothetical protein
LNDQAKDKEVVRRMHTGFWCESQGKRPLGGLDISWRIILKWMLTKIGWGGMDCTDLAQNRENQ